MEKLESEDTKSYIVEFNINLPLITRIVEWDKKNKRLSESNFKFLKSISDGIIELDENSKKKVIVNLIYLKKRGFV